METKNDFAAQVAAAERAQEHAQEIKNSRVGGLGGSDAALVLKVGNNGLASLSSTDNKRLAVMLGMVEQQDFGGNAYTNAGHMFEDYVAQAKPWGNVEYEREAVVAKALVREFKTFAHADFSHDGVVVECKYVQKPTEKVANEYAAQLQWYYMLGAREVYLLHGQGDVEPFEVQECKLVKIERDDIVIDTLLNGLAILNKAIATGWRPTVTDKADVLDTPDTIRQAFNELVAIKAQEDALKARKDAVTEVLKSYCEEWLLTGISGQVGEETKSVVYIKESESRTFDYRKLLKEHPEFNEDKYFKTAKRSASISLR